jgi:predicted nucleotidyltransferase
MKELKALNLVSLERVGNVNLWRVNKKSYAYHTLSRIIKGLRKTLRPVEHLKSIIRHNLPKTMVEKAVLFGSIATGQERPNSDIDLFLLVKDKKTKDKIKPYINKLFNLCLDLYGNRLSPYVLTKAELAKKQNLPLVSKIKNGIPLYPQKRKRIR